MANKVPFMELISEYREMQAEIDAAIRRVIQSGWFILGPELERFENELAGFCGVRYAFGVGSGTDALHLALQALGVGPGDEVITVAHTFIATSLPITFTGATPVFVDIDPDTYTMDPECVRAAVTSRTKAILPVHLYGQPADMGPLLQIARQYNLAIVEDACQAHGATYDGHQAGSLGHLGCFSFYPTKNLGAYGDGGAIVTSDPQLADRVRHLRNYGQEQKYYHTSIGTNSRLDEIQAAVLQAKLRHLEANNRRRYEIALAYDAMDAPWLKTPVIGAARTHAYHLYVVRTPKREALRGYFKEHGIDTLIHYPVPIHLQRAYASLGIQPGTLPVTEQAANEVVSIPIYPQLQPDQVIRVVETGKAFSTAIASKNVL